MKKYNVTSINGNSLEKYTKNIKYNHENGWILAANVRPHRWMGVHKNGTIEISAQNCTCYYVYPNEFCKLLRPNVNALYEDILLHKYCINYSPISLLVGEYFFPPKLLIFEILRT